ncbi:unnamed protein product [Prorocentrum cordatum]|uniref:Uncharacterized protein n=1 Tax=Prorocentrum cordatum TaxID=2364126 RepID=A0ABN9XFV9_9DINO|nr:unnamed protein product [Polarella glacialis]
MFAGISEEQDDYKYFYTLCGLRLKLGVTEGPTHCAKIAELLRLHAAEDEGEMINLKEFEGGALEGPTHRAQPAELIRRRAPATEDVLMRAKMCENSGSCGVPRDLEQLRECCNDVAYSVCDLVKHFLILRGVGRNAEKRG